ncbi:hypothetical protein [Histidinibacterium lentulum]|uniref:Uncharacterized protein n=1 Tax=Histidinibacterium lentulum TaxID=2480588 RepID=A0A3N2QUX7_9RHOB|nr:hypothetical protein [Histidinibacterium lentulum]ROT99006.1 hypothetical protein EAT49_15375 [Histidinibacterium lentulum]
MLRPTLLAAAALGLMACEPMPPASPPSGQPVAFPPTTLPFFGTGYRAEGDVCRRIGEDAYTNQFLDDAADLVGCPEDAENLGVFVTETGAREVARRDGYVLYSVPVR